MQLELLLGLAPHHLLLMLLLLLLLLLLLPLKHNAANQRTGFRHTCKERSDVESFCTLASLTQSPHPQSAHLVSHLGCLLLRGVHLVLQHFQPQCREPPQRILVGIAPPICPALEAVSVQHRGFRKLESRLIGTQIPIS